MLETEVGFLYRAFGLTIHSELRLPELMPADEPESAMDVHIKLDPFLKSGFDGEAYDFVADTGNITVKMPDAGVFRVQDGHTIIISPYAFADEGLIRLYTLGTCCGILMLQRGIYPLHGSAVAIGGKAIAIVGNSGAGKSTLASALLERGCGLVSDDVIAVDITEDGRPPLASSAYPQQKLWQNSLEALGRSSEELSSIYGRESKFCVPVKDRFHSGPLPLAAIVELTGPGESAGDAICSRVGNLQSLPLLMRHTYRYQLLGRMHLLSWHFRQSAALAARLPLYSMARPAGEFSVPQMADCILKTIAAGE
ncbi:HPr kinase/phosphorylase [Paenibacillus sp. CAU 1782]